MAGRIEGAVELVDRRRVAHADPARALDHQRVQLRLIGDELADEGVPLLPITHTAPPNSAMDSTTATGSEARSGNGVRWASTRAKPSIITVRKPASASGVRMSLSQ